MLDKHSLTASSTWTHKFAANVRFRTAADNGGFSPAMVCPLMTHQRHRLCTAAMVLMPVSASIKVLV
jgi:hypothetical protein